MVETADKKKKLTVEWIKNMAEKSKPEITTPLKTKPHYTKILFSLDFSRFDQKVKGITDNFISILHKRCIDAAAANLGLTVNFYLITSLIVQETKWKFKSFEDYMDLYSDYFDRDNVISYEDKDKQVWLCPDCLVDMTFVNGAECSRGTHIKAVKQYVAKAVSEFVKKKNKIDVTAKGIDGKYGIFGSFEVSNPAYSSQTKEELTVPVESFYKDGHKFEFPDKFQQKILKSEIVSLVLDWYAKKQEAEDLAKVRKMNKDAKKLLRSDKFIDCNSKKRTERTLIIFEGDSAGAAFRTCRNPVTQAAYFMRGVPKSVYGCTMTEIMKNQVFNDIVNIIGLQWGIYNDKNDLRFSKIIIGSDMDPDGSHIAGLLLLFFNCFPELFEQHMICRLISPFIIAMNSFASSGTTDSSTFVHARAESIPKGSMVKPCPISWNCKPRFAISASH
jgi:DNA topoisomerase-2